LPGKADHDGHSEDGGFMKTYLSIVALISLLQTGAYASFQSEKKQIYQFCDSLYPEKMEMRKGNTYPSPKSSFVTELQRDPQKTNYYTLCVFLTGFKPGFDKNYRQTFEAKKKGKISDAEVNQIQDQFADLIYNDSNSVKKKLVTGTYQDYLKYSNQKMQLILNKFRK
jgi:hypothetical protein